MENTQTPKLFGTTIVGVKQGSQTAIAGDGQVSFETTIMKHSAKKVRRMYNDNVIAGFAGAVADAMTLFDKFEGKLEEYRGNLYRAAVELAKEWRTDRFLRRLEAMLLVADKEKLFVISGNGEVLEPDDGVAGIGSGGPYALAAARAMVKHSGLTAEEIAKEALLIASSICVFTNNQIVVETLGADKHAKA